jgi:6-phosphofructokinase
LDNRRFDRAAATAFVAKLLDQAEQRGHPTRDWIVDHVCFRTETLTEYQSSVAAISNPTHDLYGTVLSHAEVNGRPITTVRLSEPLQVRVLGHIQRGGSPVTIDRILATAFGVHAVDLAAQKKYGRVVGYRGGQISDIGYDEFDDGTRAISLTDPYLRAAESIGICLGR